MGKGLEYAYNHLISINKKILKLADELYEKLQENEKVILYSKKSDIASGIISFNIKGKSPQEVATILNDVYGIAVRSGYMCAPLVQKYLKTDKLGGVVRVSLSMFNKKREVKLFLQAIKKLT